MYELNELYEAAALATTAIIVATHIKYRKKEKLHRNWIINEERKRAEQERLKSEAKLLKELRSEKPLEFSDYLRIMPADFNELLALVRAKISKKDTLLRLAISPLKRLEVTLRFLATGDTYTRLHEWSAIHRGTIQKILPVVCDAIYEALKDYIQVPSTRQEWEIIADNFERNLNMPHCIGAIGGKHVVVNAPRAFPEIPHPIDYEKDTIALLAVADDDCKFMFVNVEKNGRASIDNIFATSDVCTSFERGSLSIPQPKCLPGTVKLPYFLVGDNAFELDKYLMKQYATENITPEKQLFNYGISRAHRSVEKAFGIMAYRFRVLSLPMRLSQERSASVVLACCVLHNFLKSGPSRELYSSNELLESGNEDSVIMPRASPNNTPVGMIPLTKQNGYNVNSREAENIRDTLCHYVNSAGLLPG